jgi:hypothetical protein
MRRGNSSELERGSNNGSSSRRNSFLRCDEDECLYHFLKLSLHNTCIHQRVHLFEDIQPHTLHAIVSKLQNLLTVPCEVLIEQGVPGNPMYFIAFGIGGETQVYGSRILEP